MILSPSALIRPGIRFIEFTVEVNNDPGICEGYGGGSDQVAVCETIIVAESRILSRIGNSENP
jgi:hypothetical protein